LAGRDQHSNHYATPPTELKNYRDGEKLSTNHADVQQRQKWYSNIALSARRRVIEMSENGINLSKFTKNI